MYPPADTPRIRPTGAVYFLGPEEIIKKGDLCRSTGYSSTSDYVEHGALRDMDWRRIGDDYGETLGAWVGKTLQEFLDRTQRRWPIEIIREQKEKHG